MADLSVKEGLDAMEVASYLRRHPDFLGEFPDIALALVLPREQGQAASLASYQLDVLRDKNRELNRRLHELIEIAHENQLLMVRVNDVERAPIDSVGPALQRDPAFPDSVNVGFVQVLDRAHLRLRVYERGVGETLACGSGACAAAAVAMRQGWVDRGVAVELPGGTLHIDWPDDAASIAMTGPAAFVFEGEWIA
jgi:diaminopimelate epimerase